MGDWHMTKRTHFSIGHTAVLIAALLCAALLAYCSREEKGELYREEGVLTEVNYQELIERIDTVENSIRQQPTDTALRLQLMEISIDTSRNVIWAVGRGAPMADARSAAVGAQYAERAALIDAYRWIAFLNMWKKDHTYPDFTAIDDASVPAVVVVLKDTLRDNSVRVLVESDL